METPPAPPSDGALTEVTSDEKTMAMLAHLSGLAVAFIGPIIILLVKGQESEFVKYHAIQALVFQTFSFCLVFAVIFVTCGLGFPIAFLPMVGSIFLGMQSYNGSWDGYPLLSGIGRAPPK